MESERIKFEAYKDDELDSRYIESVVDLTQSAFSAKDIPIEEDILDHILGDLTVILALRGDEPVGFGSALGLENTVVQHGAAVDPCVQEKGLGKALIDCATLLEARDDEVVIGGRTQSPFYVKYISEKGGYPCRDRETNEDLVDCLRELANYYSPDSELEGHVLRKAYPEPLYKEEDLLESQEVLSEFVDSEVNLFRGDGILAAAQTTVETLGRAIIDAGYELEYAGEKVKVDCGKSNCMDADKTLNEMLDLMGAAESKATTLDMLSLRRDEKSSFSNLRTYDEEFEKLFRMISSN